MKQNYLDTSIAIYTWLASLQVSDGSYNDGGIFDPIDGRVMGEHYSTTHFALLGLLLEEKGIKIDSSPIKKALEFHFRTAKDEYKEGDWAYHWDFNNYALVRCFQLLKPKLIHSEIRKYRLAMEKWRENKHNAVNWILMRAFNTCFRGKELKKLSDSFRYYRHIRYALKSQLQDGCIDDERKKSRPIQYHVFSAALLHKNYVSTGNPDILKSFLRAVEYAVPFIDPAGDFNYLGRGQEQIFGYGALLYTLEAAKPYLPAKRKALDDCAARCWDYLSTFRSDEGWFPLVLNDRPNCRSYAWYDYHHLSVYNAFLGVWLAEAANLPSPDIAHEIDPPSRQRDVVLLASSSVAFLNNDVFHCCVAAGQKSRYLADCGLAIQHLYIDRYGPLISCPGGPGGIKERLFAKRHASPEDVSKNFSAPLVLIDEQWTGPVGSDGRITCHDNRRCRITYDYADRSLSVIRSVSLDGATFVLDDTITVPQNSRAAKLRVVNLPLLAKEVTQCTDSEIEAFNGARIRVRVTTNLPCTFGRENLKTAKGDVVNCYWELSNRAKTSTDITARILISRA